MASAYLVKYSGPNGPCPDAVVTVDFNHEDDIVCVAAIARQTLATSWNRFWKPAEVLISSIAYLGPWFPAPGQASTDSMTLSRVRDCIAKIEWSRRLGPLGGIMVCPWCNETPAEGHKADCPVGHIVKALSL